MNELEQIKAQLNDINTKRIQLQTLSEQAKIKCSELEQKYNVSSPEEFKTLVDKAQASYNTSILEAKQYIQDANMTLSSYSGII